MRHDAKPHTARIVVDFLDVQGIATALHATVLSSFGSLRLLAVIHEFKCYGTGIQKQSREESKLLQVCFKKLGKDGLAIVLEKWPKHWQKCIRTDGGYLKKEQINLKIKIKFCRAFLSLLFELPCLTPNLKGDTERKTNMSK